MLLHFQVELIDNHPIFILCSLVVGRIKHLKIISSKDIIIDCWWFSYRHGYYINVFFITAGVKTDSILKIKLLHSCFLGSIIPIIKYIFSRQYNKFIKYSNYL